MILQTLPPEKNLRNIFNRRTLKYSLTKYMGEAVIFNKFMRNYIPFIRGKWKDLLKNRENLFDRL